MHPPRHLRTGPEFQSGLRRGLLRATPSCDRDSQRALRAWVAEVGALGALACICEVEPEDPSLAGLDLGPTTVTNLNGLSCHDSPLVEEIGVYTHRGSFSTVVSSMRAVKCAFSVESWSYSDFASYVFALDDRVLLKWWAKRASGGNSTSTVTISTEGTAAQSFIRTTMPYV